MMRYCAKNLSLTLFTVTTGLAMFGFNKPASACSCALQFGFDETIPEDGAAEVPTDVAFLVSVGLGTVVTLLDEEDNEIATTREHVSTFGQLCRSSLEVTPTEPLLPHHTYRLVATSDDEEAMALLPTTVSFTTGEGPAEVVPSPAPAARLAVFQTSYYDSCSNGPVVACLASEGGDMLEVQVDDDGPLRRHVAAPSALTRLSLGELSGEVCITVRSRDVAGNLSEPLEQCFHAEDIYELEEGADDGSVFDSPCESEAVQALLEGKLPSPADAGPTSSPPTPDAGPLGTDDGASDTGAIYTGVLHATEVGDASDVGIDTDNGATSEHFAVDAAIEEHATPGEGGADKPAAGNNAAGNSPGSSDDSGCSITGAGTRGSTPSFGLLLAAFAAVVGRRTVARRK